MLEKQNQRDYDGNNVGPINPGMTRTVPFRDTKHARRQVCPVCNRGNGAWVNCQYAGCCDGRGLVEVKPNT